MNLKQILKEREQKRKDKEQLKKDIQEANKHFFTNLFKNLHNEK
jgi:hypothetical protein